MLVIDKVRKVGEKKAKILVVDDEDRKLRLVEAMLLPQGYEVILAHDGEEALEKVKEIPMSFMRRPDAHHSLY